MEERLVVAEHQQSEEVIVISDQDTPQSGPMPTMREVLPDGFDTHFHFNRLIKSEKHKKA